MENKFIFKRNGDVIFNDFKVGTFEVKHPNKDKNDNDLVPILWVFHSIKGDLFAYRRKHLEMFIRIHLRKYHHITEPYEEYIKGIVNVAENAHEISIETINVSVSSTTLQKLQLLYKYEIEAVIVSETQYIKTPHIVYKIHKY